jgi:hypothetical protein
MGKPEGKRTVGKPKLMLEDNKEIGWGGVDWIDLT